MSEYRSSEDILAAIQDYENLQQTAEENMNFLEADKASTAIKKLKEMYEKKCKEEMGDRQNIHQQEIVEAHEKELGEMNDEWEGKLREYEEWSEQA
jgi:hypothetical protein